MKLVVAAPAVGVGQAHAQLRRRLHDLGGDDGAALAVVAVDLLVAPALADPHAGRGDHARGRRQAGFAPGWEVCASDRVGSAAGWLERPAGWAAVAAGGIARAIGASGTSSINASSSGNCGCQLPTGCKAASWKRRTASMSERRGARLA